MTNETTTTITTKECRRCGERKPLDAFYKNRHYHDGHKTICKACELELKHQREAKAEEAGEPAKKEAPKKSLTASERGRNGGLKAARNKAQRPSLVSRNAVEIIEQMEADRQPWLIMKYPYTVPGIPDMSGVCYEVVIWQTCEAEHVYAAFEMDADTAREVARRYGCTQRKKYKKENATIWACNDRLQELHRRYAKARDRMKAKAKAARDLYYALADCRDLFGAEEYERLRDLAADAEQDILIERERYAEEYPAKNGIIIYNL